MPFLERLDLAVEEAREDVDAVGSCAKQHEGPDGLLAQAKALCPVPGTPR